MTTQKSVQLQGGFAPSPSDHGLCRRPTGCVFEDFGWLTFMPSLVIFSFEIQVCFLDSRSAILLLSSGGMKQLLQLLPCTKHYNSHRLEGFPHVYTPIHTIPIILTNIDLLQ